MHWMQITADLPIFRPSLSLTTCHALFHLMWVAGQSECPNTECMFVCVWVCAFHCLWGHEIAPKPEGTLGNALPRRRACLFSSAHASLSSCPSTFHLCPAWGLQRHYRCMHVWFLSTCSSSLCSSPRPSSQAVSHLSINHFALVCCWGE